MAKAIRIDGMLALIKPSCDCRGKRQTVRSLPGRCKSLKCRACGKVTSLPKKEATRG